jgi:tetratricopeptide (TPR) repeat protein
MRTHAVKNLCFFSLISAAAVCAQQGPVDPLGARDIKIKRVASPSELGQQVRTPRGYALVVGIGNYKNIPDQPLRFAESDAEAVYRVLISPEGGRMEPENVKKLIGSKATLANIKDALENWLVKTAKEEDRVIVYFAGHGLVDSSRGYLAPFDVDKNNIAGTGYPMDKLGTVLGRDVKAAWKVLLTDACHSGKITPETSQEAVYEGFQKLPKNFLTLTSSRESEVSFEDPKLSTGFGLFSYYLVQGWQGQADVDPRDGVITADELIDYVRNEVRAYARSKGARQTPTERGDFPSEMWLGFSSDRRAKLTSASAPQLANGTLIVEVNLDDVEVYVDDKLVGKASPSKELRIPGLSSGPHVIKGVRMGYDPASKEVLVVPGQEATVSLRIQYKRNIKKAARDLYDQGMEIYGRRKAEGDLKRAAELFTKAMKEEPQYSEAALGLCLTQQILQETEAGKKACKKAIDLDPDFVEARVHYGALLVESGDTSEAIRQLSAATARDTKNTQAYSHLSEAFLLAKAYDKAEEAGSKAIELGPKNSQGYLFRGDARRMQKKYVEAIDDYKKYLELDNFIAPVYQKIGVSLIGFGLSYRNAGQKRVFATQRSSAYFGLCGCETELKNFLRAREYCEKALSIDKTDATSFNMLGTIFMELFNRDNRRDYLVKAQESLQQALAINPAADFAKEAKQNLVQVRELLPVVR